ncbi:MULTISPECIES: hypothetical protein [unclassified Variovorax]|uniref:hypothetical protein n=1 Tax=unclassified Variovorax TaxID=663243 RepID=UPI00076D850E|nr:MULTISPECIES: hypothetical protein [unclassified Variovorax]KWT98189.1 hypothetical protein APY03_0860 [Variovorax sp. WDL1]PNG50321.1 hypothetical protein CHC06_05944 [Variovorax sp. B2]PNG51194.1 hypothetical protein CHC07_05850 [Variovorax sp. B4]VTV17416.1 hypothetical protein WDL1P1_00371 [Variovorax sp. WDL1]
MDNKPLPLSHVALTTPPGIEPKYSPYGYVVEADGTTHALCYRWMHGVITALLYPELALKHKAPPLEGSPEDLDVFAFQAFEHEVACRLPLVRIAYSLTTGSTALSKGAVPPTDVQIEGVRRALNQLGLSGQDTLTGEEDDPTVNEQLERMRNERLEAEAESQAAVEPTKGKVAGEGEQQ